MNQRNFYRVSTLAILVLSLMVGVSSSSVHAVTASQWNAGRIIDDASFTDKNGMSVAQIQDFLNRKVGTGGYASTPGQCDTNGTKSAQPFSSSTRAEYARSLGRSDKFTCLSNYYEVPKTTPGPNVPASNYGGAPIPPGARSAAQLIWDAAQQHGISPKVLLTTIQKESAGPLTTDDWPFQKQFTYAMGAHCPDSGPGGAANCDVNYSGFSLQISESAELFRWYLNNMDQPWWTYKKLGNNNILYQNAKPECGSSVVNITTRATAALYTYTPYQPNAAALNNMYGTGDSCSAYGNRNFWRIYNDWFDAYQAISNGLTMQTISQPDSTPFKGQTVSYTFSLRNNLSDALVLDAVGVVGRAGTLTGANRDFGWTGQTTIQPGQTQQFTFSTTIVDTGTVYAWPAVNYQGTYVQYNNWGIAMNSRSPNISLVSPLTSSNTNPIAGQTATLSATVRNNEAEPVSLSALGIPIRYYDRYSYDTAWMTPAGPLQPNATQAVSGSVTFDKPGPYAAWVSGVVAGQYNTLSPILKLNTAKVTPVFGLTYIETPNATPAIGEDVVVKFKLKNNSGVPMRLDAVGVVGRLDSPYSGVNQDFGWIGPSEFAVNEEKTFTTFSSSISQLRNLYAWPALLHEGAYIQFQDQKFMMIPHLPNLTLVTPVTINSGQPPVLSQPMSVSVTVRNNEPRAIRYSAAGVPIRYYDRYSYDTAWQGPGTFAPAGQSGDTVSLSGTVTFDKPGPYTIWTSAYINGRYITVGNTLKINL